MRTKAELKQEQSNEFFIRVIWFGTLIGSLWIFCGCNTVKENVTEAKAEQAASWVKERQGFIEDAVAAITRVAVYSAEKDTFEREKTLGVLHSIAGNLNALVANGIVDPDEIKKALKIDEPYFGSIASAVASLIQVEIGNFKDNGYADLTVSILAAVSKGITDGTTL
jgi:hypothetical protein